MKVHLENHHEVLKMTFQGASKPLFSATARTTVGHWPPAAPEASSCAFLLRSSGLWGLWAPYRQLLGVIPPAVIGCTSRDS